MPDSKEDRIHAKKEVLRCIYCKEPRKSTHGQMCSKCRNDPHRREHYNPERSLFKDFTGV